MEGSQPTGECSEIKFFPGQNLIFKLIGNENT